MYKFILNMPISILVVILYSWIAIYFSGIIVSKSVLIILSSLSLLCGLAWLISINSYLNKALEKKETDIITVLFLVLYIPGFYEMLTVFINGAPVLSTSDTMEILFFAMYIGTLILLTIKIRKIFYERSAWFLILELLFYPFGVLTLTPEIREHYSENKDKMDKSFAGNPDEEILNP